MPTVISVPDRVYPSGYQVECGGCQSTKEKGQLVIQKAGSGDEVVVTIHP